MDVTAIAVSPNGEVLASVSKDRTTKLWDIMAGQPLPAHFDHRHPISDVVFSADGKLMATGGHNYEARIWDLQSGSQLQILRVPGHSVGSLVFSPNGQLLATAGRDRVARLWDVATGELSSTFRGHTDDLEAISFSPDGKTLATASRDATVRLRETAIPNRVQPSAVGSYLCDLAFSDDGQRLALATMLASRSFAEDAGNLRTWNLKSGHMSELGDANVQYPFVAFASSGHLISGDVSLQSASLNAIPHGANHPILSRDVPGIFCGDDHAATQSLAIGDTMGRIVLYDAESFGIRHQLRDVSDDEVLALRFVPDGSLLAAAISKRGEKGSQILIWNTKSGCLRKTITTDQLRICALDFSPNGAMLASGGMDDLIKLWQVRDSSEIGNLRGHTMWVVSLTFSRDGLTIASGSADGTIKLWNIATLKASTVHGMSPSTNRQYVKRRGKCWVFGRR